MGGIPRRQGQVLSRTRAPFAEDMLPQISAKQRASVRASPAMLAMVKLLFFYCLFLLSCARHLPVWRTLEEASSTSARVSRPVPPLRVGRNAADDCFEDGSCQRRRVDNFSAARRESEPCEDLRWCSRLRMELTSWSVSGRTGKQTHAEVFSPKQAFKYGGVLSLWP